MLKDKIKIILITFNRKDNLKKTFKQIFAENSPIKDFDITVLDNASTDGTSELIEEYKLKFSNIEHIKHPINIGGNANICRALEYAYASKKDYFWIICDDDTFRLKHWQLVEQAILSDNYDCILAERKVNFEADNYPFIINTLSFVAAGIYKTKNINSTVIFNAYNNIMYSFPHLALGCHLLNIKAKFFIPKYRLIKQGSPDLKILNNKLNKNAKKKVKNKSDFIRGTNKEVHFRARSVNLFSGMVNSYQMIINKKLRAKCCNVLWVGESFIKSIIEFITTNKCNMYNFMDFYFGINFQQKILFLFVLLILNPLLLIIYIYKTPKGLYIRLFNIIKTRIIPFKSKI